MPTFVDVGMIVKEPSGLLCTVACVAGDMARVENTLHTFSKWFRVDELRIETPF